MLLHYIVVTQVVQQYSVPWCTKRPINNASVHRHFKRVDTILGDSAESSSPLSWRRGCLIWWYKLWCCLLQKPDRDVHGLYVRESAVCWKTFPASNEWRMHLCVQVKGGHFQQMLCVSTCNWLNLCQTFTCSDFIVMSAEFVSLSNVRNSKENKELIATLG